MVECLKKLGYFVAVTDDCINDRLDLKLSDVSFSIGIDTEVTKDASSVILMENKFSIIVDAVMCTILIVNITVVSHTCLKQ